MTEVHAVPGPVHTREIRSKKKHTFVLRESSVFLCKGREEGRALEKSEANSHSGINVLIVRIQPLSLRVSIVACRNISLRRTCLFSCHSFFVGVSVNMVFGRIEPS